MAEVAGALISPNPEVTAAVTTLPVQPKVTSVTPVGEEREQGKGQELLFQQSNAHSDVLTGSL